MIEICYKRYIYKYEYIFFVNYLSFGKISVLMDSDRSRSVDTGRGYGPLAPRTRGPHYSRPPTDPWPWHWAPEAICVGLENLDLSIHTGS